MSLQCSSLLLLLAQDLDKADQAIDTVDKLGKAGPVTISLVMMIGAIVFAVLMMRKNWKLQAAHADELREREKAAKTDSNERLKEVLGAAKERRDTEKQMLREQIEDGQKSTQALQDSARAQEANTRATEDLRRRFDEFERKLIDLQRDITDSRRSST
jgi:predicted RNase H-like nuclease (RuvC/YqgF family)